MGVGKEEQNYVADELSKAITELKGRIRHLGHQRKKDKRITAVTSLSLKRADVFILGINIKHNEFLMGAFLNLSHPL